MVGGTQDSLPDTNFSSWLSEVSVRGSMGQERTDSKGSVRSDHSLGIKDGCASSPVLDTRTLV